MARHLTLTAPGPGALPGTRGPSASAPPGSADRQVEVAGLDTCYEGGPFLAVEDVRGLGGVLGVADRYHAARQVRDLHTGGVVAGTGGNPGCLGKVVVGHGDIPFRRILRILRRSI